jgi:fumarate hydratase subunit alpha
MREIKSSDITDTVARLAIEANTKLGEDVVATIRRAREVETSPMGREVLDQLLENVDIAADSGMALCQDCGLAILFLEIGQDVHIVGGGLQEAINEGVRRAYKDGFLRKSAVTPPFSARKNTGDNTPAIIHSEIVPGDRLKMSFMPKGGGSENMSALGMLTPAAGRQGVINFVVGVVERAGSNPCPPVVVGVGVGGSADYVMKLAKKSLLRPLNQPNPDPELAALEREIFERVNKLGIGPMGYGGLTTALAVHVESAPCHIASMPVGVNIQCHSARWKTAVL